MASPTKPRVEWSTDHDSPEPRLRQSEVAGPVDLERVLYDLGQEAAATQPFIAELVTSAGARLGIGLGTSKSVLSFKESDDPPYFLSAGQVDVSDDDDDDVGFYFQGHWSEFPQSALVPAERAREAARAFFETGERPDVVEWEEV